MSRPIASSSVAIATGGMELFDYVANEQRADRAGRDDLLRTPHPRLHGDIAAIARILQHRCGAASGITAPDLADAVGLFQGDPLAARGTKIRALITAHLLEFPWPVVAGSTGYYRPATRKEAAHYARTLLSRAAETISRLADYCALAAETEYRDQVPSADTVRRLLAHVRSVR